MQEHVSPRSVADYNAWLDHAIRDLSETDPEERLFRRVLEQNEDRGVSRSSARISALLTERNGRSSVSRGVRSERRAQRVRPDASDAQDRAGLPFRIRTGLANADQVPMMFGQCYGKVSPSRCCRA
ncbi:MAG: hypothetical protein MZV70_40665 [Desulfobacterales bacterium]|nr:hypothetical protein [Desulfobacterales bacterium]